MSTQTGIQANDQLREFFGKCREGNARGRYRLIKVIISNETLVLDEAKETKGSWSQDWDGYVLPAIDENEPCYMLYRYLTFLSFTMVIIILKFQTGRERRRGLQVAHDQLVSRLCQHQK